MSTPGLDDEARAALVRNDRYWLSQVAGTIGVAPPGVLSEPGEALPPGQAVVRFLNRIVLEWLVLPFLRFNERLIRRRCDPRAILAREELPCLADLEAQWPLIREEVDALLAAPTPVPLLRSFIPDLVEAEEFITGRGGSWHGFAIIDSKRRWIDFNAEQCPRTCEVLRSLPKVQTAIFSVFTPHTVLPPHQGPNKGQVTIHLGVVVPEPHGSCVLQAGEETAIFEEGVAFAFDDTNTHTAWSEGDGPRVSLVIQVQRPVPWPASWTNRIAQPLFTLFSYPRGGWGRLLREAHVDAVPESSSYS
jgi:beta-hydroxylase